MLTRVITFHSELGETDSSQDHLRIETPHPSFKKMPSKNIKKTKKNNTKEQRGASPSQERITRERAWLNVEMKSFQQPTIKDSLASQGMTLRGGRTVRAEQGDLREGTYMELIGSDNDKKMKENPQSLPKDKENPVTPPFHPALKHLVRDPKKTIQKPTTPVPLRLYRNGHR